MPFTLAGLPYATDALEPHIDKTTMEIHHGKHHAAYVNNLNAALEKYPQLQQKSIEDLIRGINSVPEDIRTAVRNNAGGYFNHNIYWAIMGPNAGGEPKGKLAAAISSTFGSFAAFKQELAANKVSTLTFMMANQFDSRPEEEIAWMKKLVAFAERGDGARNAFAFGNLHLAAPGFWLAWKYSGPMA